MTKRLAANGWALLGMLASANALADGFYVGAGIGEATVEVDSVGFEADDTAFKIFGGYNINSYFAVEAAYFDGGEAEQSFGNGSVSVALDGLNVSAVGRLPINDVFSLFGKIGYASYEGDIKGRVGNTVVASDSGSDEDLTYGVGAAFNLGPAFELRAEYEAIDVSDSEISMLFVSGLYKF